MIQNRLNELLPVATELIQESFDLYDGKMPFGLSVEEFVSYAARQYRFRVEAIERALAQSP